MEQARIEAKKAASLSPSRNRGGSPTTRLPPSKEDGKSMGRGVGTGKKSSKSMDKKGTEVDGMGGTDGMRSHKSTFMDPGKGEFRREYSGDHPLAPGGKGHYKSEKASGKSAVSVKKMSYTDKSSMTPAQASRTVEKLFAVAESYCRSGEAPRAASKRAERSPYSCVRRRAWRRRISRAYGICCA